MIVMQVVTLTEMMVLHFYPLMIYNTGSCPGQIVGSYDPETLKTTTTLIGNRMFSDPSHFLECGSSKESIEMRQTSTTLPTLLDDTKRGQAMEDLLVGSFQAASKSTVAREAAEKIGGIGATLNFKKGDTMHPKIKEGRQMFQVMTNEAKKDKSVSSVRENYSKKIKHTNALNTTDLPRDYLAAFKKHMLFENQDDAETEYQNIHLAACEELSEAKPEYDPRRLEPAAHPLAMVMLVQKDVEELNKEDVTKLFVEVYGDREKFLKVYIEELDKADTVIDEMTQTRRKHSVREEEEEVSEEDLDTKIEKILDRFEDANPLERTRFVKAFIEKDKSQVLAIAHTKLDQFDKTWTNVKFPKLPAGFTKPFTREDSTSAKTKTIGATCKLFPLKNMKQTLQDKIRDIFPELKIQEVEQDQEEDEEEGDDLAGSQDFPGVHQSQGTETLKTCNTCNFQSRMEDEMINHMKTHYKCQECQKTFSTERTLKIHMSKVHEQYVCTI